MQTPFSRSFYVTVASLLLSGSALANNEKIGAVEEPKIAATAAGESLNSASPSIRPGLAGSFLSSRFARQSEDLDEASRYLTEAMKADPTNEKLKQEAMRTYLLAGNLADAEALAAQLVPTAKGDPLVSTILMLAALDANDVAKAQGWAQASPDAGLYGIVRPVVLEWLKIAKGETKNEANLKAAIDKSGFFAPFLTYHLALMNDTLGNTAAARAAYAKASADPAITPYRVVEAIANFHERQGEWDKAQAVFDNYAKANPDSSLIPPKLVATKDKVQPLIASPRDGLAELYFTTASILFGEDATQDTFLYLRIALALKPDLPPAQLMLANLYEQTQDYAAAVDVYDRIAPGTVFYRRGQIRKALNFEAMGKKNEAIDLLDKIAATNPTDNLALITKGDMLRDQSRYGDALAAYSEAIHRAEPLRNSGWPLLYARGISYERTNQWDKAEMDFNRALQLEPNQPDVLNYLAYSWLTMNKNVDKARDYLEIALSARPEDPHIIDSMGWAQYMAGNYPKAVEYFEKAADIMPDDVIVNDHLGDAYWRVGRQTEAKFSWQRALNGKPEPGDVDVHSLKDKLENGLPAAIGQTAQVTTQPATVDTAVAVPVVTQVQ